MFVFVRYKLKNRSRNISGHRISPWRKYEVPHSSLTFNTSSIETENSSTSSSSKGYTKPKQSSSMKSKASSRSKRKVTPEKDYLLGSTDSLPSVMYMHELFHNPNFSEEIQSQMCELEPAMPASKVLYQRKTYVGQQENDNTSSV